MRKILASLFLVGLVAANGATPTFQTVTVTGTATLPAATTFSGTLIGSLATQNGTFSGTSSGTNTGDQTLSSLGITGTSALYGFSSGGVAGTVALGSGITLTSGTLSAAGTSVASGTQTAVVTWTGAQTFTGLVTQGAATTTTGTVGTLTVTGNSTVNGNTTLGDASGDTLTINAGTATAPNATSTSSGNNLINMTTQDARYLSKVVMITSSTAVVTNSTTYTDVPGISIPLAVGSYRIRLNGTASQSVGGSTGGAKIALAFTGTASGNGSAFYIGQASTSAVSFNTPQQLGELAYSTSPLTIRTETNNSVWANATLYLTVTGTGNLTIQMAESTATVGTTINARAGTSLEATQY